MATSVSTKSITREVTKTVLVPTIVIEQVTENKEVAQLSLNMRSKADFVFDPSSMGALFTFLKANDVPFTLRIKAGKTTDEGDVKRLSSINNQIIRLARDAMVPARKDAPSTPTAACNDCTNCVQ